MVSNHDELCRAANGPASSKGSQGRSCRPDAPAHTINALIERSKREDMVTSSASPVNLPADSVKASVAGSARGAVQRTKGVRSGRGCRNWHDGYRPRGAGRRLSSCVLETRNGRHNTPRSGRLCRECPLVRRRGSHPALQHGTRRQDARRTSGPDPNPSFLIESRDFCLGFWEERHLRRGGEGVG
jgi:hypothetical protein